MMLKNQWARTLINSNGRGLHRRMNVPAKQRNKQKGCTGGGPVGGASDA
jgi:hypothetical protein